MKQGYQYAKIWVHALKGSSDITCKVRDNTTAEVLTTFTVTANHSKSQFISVSPGRYYVSLSSDQEDKMKGQFNIRVSKTIKALRK